MEDTLAPAPVSPFAPGTEYDYWAMAPIDEIGSLVGDRVKEYYQVMRTSGMFTLYARLHTMVYGLGPNGHETSQIFEFGDDGEKLGVRSNQIRSLVRYMLTSATADRPHVEPKAINTTAQAMAQVPVVRRSLDYYHRVKRLERHLVACALRSVMYGKGYLWQSWDPTATRDGKPVGDLVYQALSPMEVASDLSKPAYEHDWFCITRPRNKYDLAAIFAKGDEEKRELILSADQDCLDKDDLAAIQFCFKKTTGVEADTIFERHFIHKKTPACPQGRYTIMIGDGIVLFDGPLQYSEMPVAEMIPEEFLGAGAVGYSSAWDLIALQQAYDALLSTAMSNFDAFGHNDMLLPDGVELTVETVREGLSAIRYPQGEHNKPSILEKFSVKEEIFKLKDWLRSDMEVNSGVNSVARGEPQASLQTGPALALVQAQAVHFQSGFVGAYVQLIEDVSTASVRILQKYAPDELISQIAGENDPDGLAAFKASDFSLIERIEVERINPIFKTLAGKYDLADKLLERGLIKNANQYFMVLNTGRVEVASDPQVKAEMQVVAENEILMRGPEVKDKIGPDGLPVLDELGMPVRYIPELPVVMTDHPVEHLLGHKTVLDSPVNRQNVKVVEATTVHMLDHLTVWEKSPLNFLLLMNFPVPGMPGGEGPTEPGAPGGGGGGGKPKPAPKGEQPGDGTQKDQPAPEKGSKMPSLPKAPTQDKFGRPTGA